MKMLKISDKLAENDSPDPISKKKFGSDYLVDILADNEIEFIAINPGSSINPLQDSIVNYDREKKPRLILCCHEEIAAAIAHGYAKASGRMMAVATHANVGLMHASMAIFNAWCDRVPMLVIGGIGPLDADGRRPWIDWLHSSNIQANIVSDFVKWHDQPHSVQAAAESISRACKISKTAPSAPVYLSISTTLQEEEILEAHINSRDNSKFLPPKKSHAAMEDLDTISAMMMKAAAPVIIVDFFGNNPTAVNHLLELAVLLGAPVIDCCNRYNFPSSHLLWVAGGEDKILADADFILALDVQDLYGALGSFDKKSKTYSSHINPEVFIAHISMSDYLISRWAADYQKLYPVDLSIAGDSAHAVDMILRRCKDIHTQKDEKGFFRRFKKIVKHNELWRNQSKKIAMEQVDNELTVPSSLSLIWQIVKKENFVIANCGGLTVRTWIKKLWQFDGDRATFIGNSTGGAGLGYGMGASIGVALAYRNSDKLCISMQNDGDLLYTTSALWTAAHHKIPLLILVMNNRSYGLVKMLSSNIATIRNRGVLRSHIGNTFENPLINFPELAKGFGVAAFGTIKTKDALESTLPKAIAYVKANREPVLVDISLK